MEPPYAAFVTNVTSSDRPILWRQAHDALRQQDKDVIPLNIATKPEELVAEVERYISQSKGKAIKVSNGENLFVRDVLQKVSRWIKKFVEVGDTVVQYDTGHAALPLALLRLVLQVGRSTHDDITCRLTIPARCR